LDKKRREGDRTAKMRRQAAVEIEPQSFAHPLGSR
jgi:hypothetical protein